MNRTNRLLAIVLELQRKGQQRAEDLAASFEVSVRTIYRDMQALSEARVPIIAIQKKGTRCLKAISSHLSTLRQKRL
jgi:predicted DNA-binding transcriptional regulator YafY